MLSDLRFAWRLLRKNPAFTAVAVLSLALGIGATTTVFGWIESVLLRPLPGVADQGRMVVLVSTRGDTQWDTVSLPDLKDLAAASDVFAGIVGSQLTPACLTLDAGPLWLYGQIATSNFFEVLGVQPLLGRTFVVDDDATAGGQPVLVLSEGTWRRHFNADPDIVGRAVELNRRSFTIVGVAPEEFRGTMSGLRCDFWAPVEMCREVANFGSLTNRGDRWLHTQARLQTGVTLRAAQTAASALMERLEETHPNTNRGIHLRVLPVWKAPYGAQMLLLPVLRILIAVCAGVLLIVTSNVANLQLARATARRKEIAIRLAAGTSRLRIVRQLLTESVLLAMLGCAVGVLFAFWGADLLLTFIPRTHLPVEIVTQPDATTLGFSLLLALATGIGFGMAPAWHATRHGLSEVLREGGRGSGGAEHHRMRAAFVVVQIAFALLLLIGAGLCIKGSERARRVDVGFDPQGTLLAGMRIGMNGYDEAMGVAFYRQLQERLAQQPGVQSVALASWFPLGFEAGPSAGVDVPGYDRRPTDDMSVPYQIVSPRYLETLRVPLLDGRDFADTDDAAAAPVGIVNETMAHRYWAGQNPIGRTFRALGRTITVVGVARAGKYRSLGEPPRPFFYVPYLQGVWDLNLGVAIRTHGDPREFAPTLREQVRALDAAVGVWTTIPMSDYTEAAFFSQRVTSILLLTLGAVALVLAGIGIYGVMAYTVGQRAPEIGVRVALGASPGHVMALVLGSGFRLAFLGMAIGLAGAALLTHLLAGFLFGVSPFDAVTYAGAAFVVSAATLLASWLPARRALRVDPLDALRGE